MRAVTAFYMSSDNKPHVVLVIQNTLTNGKVSIKTIPIESPPPYFYEEMGHTINTSDIIQVEEIKVMNGTFTKYNVTTPNIIPQIRDEYSREADIPYVKRVIYDSKMDLGNEPLSKCYIDTEAYNPTTRFVDFELDELKSVSMILNDGRKYVIYNLKKDTALTTTTSNSELNITYIMVPNERSLLSKFYNITENEAMYVGWNLREFDYEFVKSRSIKYNMYDFNKHIWMDLMSLYKRFVTSYSKTNIVTSFSLENVSQHELGIGKMDKKEALWGGNIDTEMEYNLRDSELVKQIDEKTKLTELIDSIAVTLNLLVDDCIYFSNAIEYTVMRELHNKYVFKNKQHNPPQKNSNYKGAFVHEAPTGIFKNIATFDFSSLYPNIIRTFNLGPETITDDTNNTISIPNLPYHYTKQRESVYNKLITRLLELRKKYKESYEQTHNETFNTMQIGVKFLIASFYGVLGFENGRLYDKRVAESITTIGQHLIKMIGEKFGSIYGDTDSVMIPIKSEHVKTEIFDIQEEMNKMILSEVQQYNTMQNTLNIRFEKMFGKVYFYGKKKRYYGIVTLDEDFSTCNYVLARGLEIRRTDWCPLAIEYETNILQLLLNDIKSAIKYHYTFIENMRTQTNDKFVIHKSITKPISEYKVIPPHIKVATEHDYIGSKIGYIVTNYHNNKIIDVSREIDKAIPSYKYYMDKQIKPIYERLLEPLMGTQQKLVM